MLRILDLANKFLILLTICVVIVKCHNSEYLNPEWVDPHDWSNEKNPLQELCPQANPCQPCEPSVKAEYLRLVKSIFNPAALRFDASTNFYHRTIHIHITKEQLKQFQKTNNPAYIDGLLSEVLSQNEFGTVQLVKEYTVDVAAVIWEKMPALPSISEMNFSLLPRSRPIFINFSLMIVMYFVCRRFGINYLIVVFFILTFCLYEYLDNECQRRVEVNEAVDYIYGKENPCKGPNKMNWYDWMLGRDSRSACRDFLSAQSAYKTQCGIVDLFHEFIYNIVLKQLTMFFQTIAELVRSISTTNGILITAVTLYFMKGLLVTIIHSVFKYLLNPTIWSRVVADVSAAQAAGTPPPTQRVEVVSDSDLRDINMSKALDLANQQMQFIKQSQMHPSSLEIIPVSTSEESTYDDAADTQSEIHQLAIKPTLEPETSPTTSRMDHQLTSESSSAFTKHGISDLSTESLETTHPISSSSLTSASSNLSSVVNDELETAFAEFEHDEIEASHNNISVVSVGESSEYSATPSSEILSTSKSSVKSEVLSINTDSGESLEILSIGSSDTDS